MNHSLNPKIANKYGLNCALILNHIIYWVNENQKNNKTSTHFHESKWWTYSSVRELSEHFTYLTVSQIRTALKSLKENELILTANFNNSCSRTLWYAISDKTISLLSEEEPAQVIVSCTEDDDLEEETIKSIDELIDSQNSEPEECPKSQNDLLPVTNPFATSDKTICHTAQNDLLPVTNGANNIPQNITTNNLEKEIYKEKETPEQQIFNFWNSKQLIPCTELSHYLETVISTALKSFALQDILLCIDRYSTIVNDSNYYFAHQWSLKAFISQANAMKDFLDNGEKWINYENRYIKPKPKDENFIHNHYTKEQLDLVASNYGVPLEEIQP